jgi:FtsP/CotA-like multicopper oxidase with cupredoxin domain
MDRRHFLTALGAGVGAAALGPRAVSGLRVPQPITLRAAAAAVAWEGGTTEAWSVGGSVPAPVLRFRRGDAAEIVLRNALNEPTILHWHGLDVPEAADGHPRLAIGPGEEYAYRFRVKDPPGLYWYHPHTHRRTAAQTYRGMAGLLVIEGDEDDALGLPSGDSELLLVLQDRRTGSAAPFDYAAMEMGPDVMMGYLGDTPFANGEVQPTVEVKRGAYRLRLLNASNARILDLGLDTGEAMTLVGTDGGLLPAPARVERVMMGTGERADLLVDFSDFPPGTRIRLRSFPFQIPGMMGMAGMGGPPAGRGPGGMGRGPGGRGPGGGGSGGMGRMMGGQGGFPQGTEMDFVTFVVGEERAAPLPSLPDRLVPPRGPSPTADSTRRSFRFESMMMQHSINGRSFDMERVDVEVPLGSTEVWTLINDSGFAHPVHVHAGQFRVLSRSGGRTALMPWEQGLKDTVLVLPGERVEIAVRFTEYPGLFLLHCHNLEHEDAGMMANFRVLG